ARIAVVGCRVLALRRGSRGRRGGFRGLGRRRARPRSHATLARGAMSDSKATTGSAVPAAEATEHLDFIREIVQQDLASGRYRGVVTRFPPEPSGYLHIGHAKSICLHFGIARQFNGQCNLRMDDTNPAKEDVEYVDSITADVKWLIAGWADQCLGLKPAGATPEARVAGGKPDTYLPAVLPDAAAGAQLEPFFASDYFGPLYEFAVRLIERGKAYVCDLSAAEV